MEKLGERDKVELACRDAMEQAFSACLEMEMLLLNIKSYGYSDEELKRYRSSLEAFIGDDVVAGELLRAVREPGHADLPSPEVLGERWNEVDGEKLPSEALWTTAVSAFRHDFSHSGSDYLTGTSSRIIKITESRPWPRSGLTRPHESSSPSAQGLMGLLLRLLGASTPNSVELYSRRISTESPHTSIQPSPYPAITSSRRQNAPVSHSKQSTRRFDCCRRTWAGTSRREPQVDGVVPGSSAAPLALGGFHIQIHHKLARGSAVSPGMHRRAGILFSITLLAVSSSMAQEPEKKSFDDLVAGATERNGLFDTYEKGDHLYLVVQADHLDREYLLVPRISQGIGAENLYANILFTRLEASVVTFERFGERLFLLEQPHRFTAEDGTPADHVIKEITMHEVGHTIGLDHNFKASSAVPVDKLGDKAWTSEHGISGSVMDYLPVNAAPLDEPDGHHYMPGVGASNRPSRAASLTRHTLARLDESLRQTLARRDAFDAYTLAHLEEASARIERILEAQLEEALP